MLMTSEQILAKYSEKISEIENHISGLKKLIDKLSFYRVGLFLLEIFLFVLLLRSENDGWRALIQIALVLPVIAFAIIVRKQSQLDTAVAYQKELLWVYQNESNVIRGHANGYDHGAKYESELHPYTSDLDIFGSSSLFALVNRCSTKSGNEVLATQLAHNNPVNTIRERQLAIKEVAAKIDDTFSFRANLHGHDVNQIELIKTQLTSQLGQKLEFVRPVFLRLYVRLVPFLTLGLILGGILISGAFWNILVLFLVIHMGWNVLLNAKINQVFYGFGGGSNLLNGYAEAIRWTEKIDWKSTYILRLFDSKIPVSKEIKALSKIIQNFDARLNLIVGGILNALFLWDLRCCISLAKWHQSCSKDVVSALNHLGDFEELISIATLAYNQPDWAFPELAETFELKTADLGHPLIKLQERVSNDFAFETKPTVDVVTGSNMAGKSTFLRTVGINLVMAYAGAPVCASQMSTAVFALNTYMRIKDSLNESTSTFKAELNRLKMILDHVVKDKSTLVLIDEMLRGTNSRDKYLGSKVFVEKLIAEKTPALFATHDLQLADLKEKHPDTLRNFHFDIQLIDGEMKFDYKLKQGPCSTFNAGILLKQIGLSLD